MCSTCAHFGDHILGSVTSFVILLVIQLHGQFISCIGRKEGRKEGVQVGR